MVICMGALQVFVVRFFFQVRIVYSQVLFIGANFMNRALEKVTYKHIPNHRGNWYRYSLAAAAAYRKKGIVSGHDAHECLYYRPLV